MIMISYFYALACRLTDIYTKLYLKNYFRFLKKKNYFRLLYNLYNMEVVHIKKINYFIFLLSPHDKFLALPLLTPLQKILGTVTTL